LTEISNRRIQGGSGLTAEPMRQQRGTQAGPRRRAAGSFRPPLGQIPQRRLHPAPSAPAPHLHRAHTTASNPRVAL